LIFFAGTAGEGQKIFMCCVRQAGGVIGAAIIAGCSAVRSPVEMNFFCGSGHWRSPGGKGVSPARHPQPGRKQTISRGEYPTCIYQFANARLSHLFSNRESRRSRLAIIPASSVTKDESRHFLKLPDGSTGKWPPRRSAAISCTGSGQPVFLHAVEFVQNW